MNLVCSILFAWLAVCSTSHGANALEFVTTFGYDENGNQAWILEPNHQTTAAPDSLDHQQKRTSFKYDALNRRIATTFPLVTRDTAQKQQKTAYDDLGRRTSETDEAGVVTHFGYDKLLTYEHCADGSLKSLKGYRRAHVDVNAEVGGAVPDVSLAYEYDNLNRLWKVTDGKTSGITFYAYDFSGNLESYTYPNQAKHQYYYTEQNRLKELRIWQTPQTPELHLRGYFYELSPTGRRTQVTETTWTSGMADYAYRRQVQYEYDVDHSGAGVSLPKLSRLTGETMLTHNGSDWVAGGDVEYVLDKIGNRKARNVALIDPNILPNQAFNYDQLDRVDSNTDPTDENGWYDANGNTIGRGPDPQENDEYDAENRLIARGSTQIAYDHEGNRVQKTTTSGTVNYLVDTQNLTGYAQVIAEYSSGSSAPLRAYAYGLDLISQQQSTTIHYYGYDGHGSVRVLIASDGSELKHYDYDAFGVIISEGGSTTENSYLYAGEQWDSDLEMYFLRARYYDAQEGRFWTMDSYEGANNDPPSLHKYLYGYADPINNMDPLGNMTLAVQVPTFGTLFTLLDLSLASLASAKATALTLTLAIAAGASLSGSTEAAQEQAAIQAAEMSLAGAGTSMANELAKAEQIWRTRNGNSRRPKFVPVSRTIMPDVANHIALAQLVHGPFLNRAHPGQGAKNRYQVLKGRGSAGPGMTWDEYPFFKSRQGGNPLTVSVIPVPQEQNWLQGGIISAAYRMQTIAYGEQYAVVITP